MSYEVLARKWRPQRFSELVGQEHISRTLKNAIARQRVAHAYLFVGSRGVGKTTSARLFAKSLNCTDLVDGEPCCKCHSCLEIAAGNSLDVIEIDGASNNGVDAIRELRENTQYTPSSGNYKIYVIDEVHMLSASAWNALLKTLEEPPPHVKFIFATTEAHKVLPTVISRCQRFDFKQIPPTLIVAKLREIADAEGIHIADSALSAIARAADGGMRDAQSIFDQMIAFCGGSTAEELITEHDVIDVFGLASTAELARLCGALLSNDISGVMVAVNALSARGRDLDRLFSELMNLFRNLMLVQLCTEASRIIEVTESELLLLKELAKSDPQVTRTLIESLLKEDGRLRQALNKRVFFEVCLVRAMHEAHAIDINDVIARFDEIKNRGHELQLPDTLKQKESFNVESIIDSLDALQASKVSTPVVESPEKKTADSITLAAKTCDLSPNLSADSVEREDVSQIDEVPISVVAGGVTSSEQPVQEIGQTTSDQLYNLTSSEMPSVAETTVGEPQRSRENWPPEAVSMGPADTFQTEPTLRAQPDIEKVGGGQASELLSNHSPSTQSAVYDPVYEAVSPAISSPQDRVANAPQADVLYEVNPLPGQPVTQIQSVQTGTEVTFDNVMPVQEGTTLDNAVMLNSERVYCEQPPSTIPTDFITPAVKSHGAEQAPASLPIHAHAYSVTPVPTESEVSHWDINELWHTLLNSMVQVPGGQLLHSYMQEAKPVSFVKGVFVSELSDDFPVVHLDTLTSFDNSGTINRVLERVTGVRQSSVSFIRTAETFLGEEGKPLGTTPEVFNRVTENPFVKNVCQLFGGEVIDARG